MVILGRVKITNVGDDGSQLVARIVSAEGLFGESALIGAQRRTEAAVALDNVTVMSDNYDCEAPLPADLRAALRELGLHSAA